MSYCAVADVQADFKNMDFSISGSFITSATVTQFIKEADALINSYVGQRWVVPITGDTSSLALMSLLSRTLVSNRVRSILENKQITNTDANQNVKGKDFGVKDVMAMLISIKAGEVQLTGASLLLASAGFYSNNQANNVPNKFHKGRKEW